MVNYDNYKHHLKTTLKSFQMVRGDASSVWSHLLTISSDKKDLKDLKGFNAIYSWCNIAFPCCWALARPHKKLH